MPKPAAGRLLAIENLPKVSQGQFLVGVAFSYWESAR